MTKRIHNPVFLYQIALLFMALACVSCETEYIDKVNTIPADVIKVPGYTHIESFTIKDTENNTISAALTEENIVITWSNHITLPETVKPEIILGTEATISPASGAEVAFKDGTVYTVTSKAGTTKKYTLKIDFRQKEPRTWTSTQEEPLAKGFMAKMTNRGTSDPAIINDLWMSLKDTRVYFVSAADQKTEYTAEIVYLGNGETAAPFLEYGVYYFLPENMPLGLYDLRIKNGAYTLQNASVENRFKIEVTEPDYFKTERFGFPTTKRSGETLEVRGGLLNELTAVEIYNTSNTAVTYPLEIVSLTSYKAVLKIPAAVPVGAYNRMRFKRGAATSNLSYGVTVQ
ncbi:hypothetical protein QQY79_17640 [Flavobacterium tructae]|uniref:hypothetical protein n=1 Tax=Flavobacterium tructae TaxID=1114873 RepID=UPI002552015B|nr:hypothetical protein [Flavobacterium tructae]MDL2144354.1 hypothetical protein [Flavobacterium tructae]